jgi:hypothetical protein
VFRILREAVLIIELLFEEDKGGREVLSYQFTVYSLQFKKKGSVLE